MAARLGAREESRWKSRGIGLIPPASGFDALADLLASGRAQAAVLPIDWTAFLAGLADVPPPPLLRLIAREVSTGASAGPAEPGIRDRLASASPEEQDVLLRAHVSEQVGRVLRLAPSRSPSPDQDLAQLGLDSLMAMELRNRLQSSLGCSLPATLALEQRTVAALSSYLTSLQVQGGGVPAPKAVDSGRAAQLLERIDDLSEQDLDQLLGELKSDGGRE
jgi:acyl carrier protein